MTNKNTEEVKTIKKLEVPKEFRKEGLLRRLVKFESGYKDVAMYEVIRENWEHGTGHRGYEVMEIRYNTRDLEYYGSVKPAGTPKLPSNEEFGKYGWHYNNFERADETFNKLVNTPLRDAFFKKKYIFI